VRELADIRKSVRVFLDYAYANPQLRFKVTAVGTGLAGIDPHVMAEMFEYCTENCAFDPEWSGFGLQPWSAIGIPNVLPLGTYPPYL
jgi:hypothetical protein